MICSGEDRVAIGINIKILPGRLRAAFDDDSFYFRENGIGIIEFTRDPGHGFETWLAKTRGLDGIGGETIEDRPGHNDFLTPAGALVEMTLGNATEIISSAKRTALIAAKAI